MMSLIFLGKIIISLLLAAWLGRIAIRHHFLLLIMLIPCINALITTKIDDINIENDTTLSLTMENGKIKESVHILNENKEIQKIDVVNFLEFLKTSPKSYLSYKFFPLNQRDRCYADLNIGANEVPILIQTKECLDMRNIFWDFFIKCVKIFFIWWLVLYILAILGWLIVLILGIGYEIIEKIVSKRKKEKNTENEEQTLSQNSE